MLEKKIKLSNGKVIPIIALGTWQTPRDVAAQAVKDAIEVGYRHIDTAVAYGNEIEVGQGFKESGIKREDIFITTKIRAEVKSYEGAKKEIEESLKRLNVDYIDLVLIHCPVPWWRYMLKIKGCYKQNVEVYRAMEEAYKEGKIKSLGISNFAIKDVKNILDHCEIKPVINQIEWHVGKRDEALREYCHENGILIEAYSPLGCGKLMKNQEVIDMAKKYGVSPAQLCIKFTLMDADITLPKTVHKNRMIENSKLNFEISKEDFETLKRY